MARPIKHGIDYFPLDVDPDNKIKFLKAKFKWEGFGILIAIFQHIYSSGFWCHWDEDDVILFADDNRIDFELLKNITDECLKREIFNRELFEKFKILTSKGIQKRYFEVAKRRKHVDIMHAFILADCKNVVNAYINHGFCTHETCKSTQRKGKERKLKESNNACDNSELPPDSSSKTPVPPPDNFSEDSTSNSTPIPQEVFNRIAADYNFNLHSFNLQVDPENWNFQSIVGSRIADGKTEEDFFKVHAQAVKSWNTERMAGNLQYNILYRPGNFQKMMDLSKIVVPKQQSQSKSRRNGQTLCDKYGGNTDEFSIIELQAQEVN